GMNTPMIAGFRMPEGVNMKEFARVTSPLGAAEPEEVAGVIAYIASDDGRYMTGSIVSIDGGVTAWGPGGETVRTAAASLGELIERRVAQTPDATMAVDEDGRTLTFREYHDAAERAAAGLAELGVGDGTPVSWVLPTWLESLVLVGALSRLGAVQNPIFPIYRHREIGFMTKQTGAKLLIVPSTWKGFDYEGMAREIAAEQPGLDVLVVDRKLPDANPASLPPAAKPPSTPDDAPVRCAFYTSGTTADPKGAQRTDRTIMASAYGMTLALALEPDDVSALVFPFTHIGGIGWLFSSMMVGFKTTVIEAFDPATTIPLMQ